MRPTPQQEYAAAKLDSHLAVTAGPGSGKTRVLVSRYLNILSDDLARVENIVAITFTNKASNEMRDRLRREIDRVIDTSRGTRFEAYWRETKRKLDGAVITTIHGFCSRLLRENPVEAVVDPQFSTLDEYTSSVLLDASAQAAITDLINHDDPHGAWLVAAYGRSTLVDHLIRVYNTLRGLGIDIASAEANTLDNLGTSESYRDALDSLTKTIDRVHDLLAGLGSGTSQANARRKVDDFLAVWDVLRPTLEAEPSPDRVQVFAAGVRTLQGAAPSRTIAKPLKAWVEDVKAAIGDKAERSKPGVLEHAFFDVLARPYSETVFTTLKALDGLYTHEKRATSALDYEDLQLKVRALLADHPRVATRIRTRYRYFLVDEFQDTNLLQRQIIEAIALGEPEANLFVVGDPKQSIYGFRGAEVEVFAQTIQSLASRSGEEVPLSVNFRSDPKLVSFFNELFGKLMAPSAVADAAEDQALGFVKYEAGSPHRSSFAESPAIEFLVDLPIANDDTEEKPKDLDENTPREREAERLAARLRELVEVQTATVLDRSTKTETVEGRPARWGDVAILLRAMTDVKVYERALRKAGIPYYVVAGKGFYDRPETRDLLNLLEFLDNRQDELALAASLRSPLFGISDETLLALRLDRLSPETGANRSPRQTLWQSIECHETNEFVPEDQHEALDEAVAVLSRLIALRNRLPISRLLDEALRLTNYATTAAAADDGAQRLSNLDKLVSIARQFERGAMRLLRDFIEYLRDFRRLEAREAEANLRTNENAVAILTIHKSKGLEFPIVVLPDLQRKLAAVRTDVLVDRHFGVAFRVPDGTGGLASTSLFARAVDRRERRDYFESIRLLYVAATRAQDRLILSGAANRFPSLENKTLADCTSWFEWLLLAFGIGSASLVSDVEDRMVGDAVLRVVGPDTVFQRAPRNERDSGNHAGQPPPDEYTVFRNVERVRLLLSPVVAASDALRGYSATSLQNFVNCPRQFYFSRLLRVPTLESAGRDAAEDVDPSSTMTASLRGLVIHRLCETYQADAPLEDQILKSLHDVLSQRGEAYSDLATRIDEQAAIGQLLPLAQNYAASRMRLRVEERLASGHVLPDGRHEYVMSELPFTLRADQGFLFGTIDKLLLWPLPAGRVRALVVDFKTNRLPRNAARQKEAVTRLADEYRLQIQIYVKAVRNLFSNVSSVDAVLHFLDGGPNVEFSYPPDLLTDTRAGRDIDRAIAGITEGGFAPENFPPRPADRCFRCSFRALCDEGLAHVTPVVQPGDAPVSQI